MLTGCYSTTHLPDCNKAWDTQSRDRKGADRPLPYGRGAESDRKSGIQRSAAMKRAVFWTCLLVLATIAAFAEQKYTRGVGIYPGNPSEDFAPAMVADSTTYRNLALLRPAHHSSSYDYNLTAQLLTDGIKTSKLPRWIATTMSATGPAKKQEREFLLDHNATSTVNLGGPSGWIQFELSGEPVEIDRIDLDATIRTTPQPGAPRPAQSDASKSSVGQWTCTILGSEDGQSWNGIGNAAGDIPPAPKPPPGSFPFFGPTGPSLKPSVSLARAARRFYRIQLKSTFESPWTVSEVAFFNKTRPVEIGGPYHFTSAWMPEGKGEEWAYVDLGARCTFDRVALYWIRRASEGVIQTSDDAKNWRDLLTLQSAGLTDDLKLSSPAQGRFVRVLMKRPASSEGYILSELEVYGRGGYVPKLNPGSSLPARADGGLNLDAGAWRLQRDSLVEGDGAAISKPGYADGNWIPATVPATVLSSYWNIGAIPDPNYGANQLMISDSFFYADFWYRKEFNLPDSLSDRKVWLNFDGINWKAEVYLNGEKLGRVEGAFTRGRFDITDRIQLKSKNALAVRVEKNATPGSMKQKTLETAGLNGGALGADNPTYHASIGWDWIPTVRGRNIGIWDDVFLTSTGSVTIENPLVKTTLPLPDTSRADVKLEASLNNWSSQVVTGTLRGRFGDVDFERSVTIEPSSVKTVSWEKQLSGPRLWWPAGYGDQNLYDVELKFETGGKISDAKSFRTGVRQLTYSEEGGALKIWINGRRFIGRGGNWGFPETNLRYRGREYDIAVGYHKDMNFTMIRNWVGQTGDDEFYEACDKHGIVVWQDFWLANPVDGPNPDDNELFLRNVKDFVLRIRNHPSVGLYCGRNEGDPPKPIDDGIRKLLPDLHPGLHYISNSAWGAVSGGGPYAAQTPKFYFKNRATTKLHSELGMPNIVGFDSLRQMMPETDLWPQGLSWGLHDFNLTSAQRLSGFQSMMDKSYGGADNAKDWVTLAQFINYDGYRAIFEAQSKNRMGILLWMSHPCWPSFVWQTYDYYFDPTAGYFGSKKGSEPLHIQWNSATDSIEVVNYSAGTVSGLKANAEILDLDGTAKWEKTATVDSAEDSVVAPIILEYPKELSPVHFIRLKLTRGDTVVSENFYWRGAEENNYTALRSLPKVSLGAMTRTEKQGSRWILKTELVNTSKHPAVMIHLKAVRSKSGDRILPALYSDNYVSLMPGEKRAIRIQIEDADTRGESPRIVLEGFNIK
jgi:hypothetical protein